MDTSRIVAAAGAVVLIAILLLAWLADTIPVDNARSLNSCTLVQCRVYLVLRDFQTILGAAAALLAAENGGSAGHHGAPDYCRSTEERRAED